MIFSIVSRNEIDVFQTIIIMYRVRVVEFLLLGVGPNINLKKIFQKINICTFLVRSHFN